MTGVEAPGVGEEGGGFPGQKGANLRYGHEEWPRNTDRTQSPETSIVCLGTGGISQLWREVDSSSHGARTTSHL